MKYVINNNGPLNGHVKIGGAKNSALALLAATLLTDEEISIINVPNVSDINNLLEAIGFLGGKYTFKENKLIIQNDNINEDSNIDYDCITKIRASYYLLGALVGRFKKASVALPGGCKIGVRPIDLHLKGLEALGVKIELFDGQIVANAEDLHGADIYLDFPSVGATINILLASVFAKGETIIKNVAKEPHIVDVAKMLTLMGADIQGAGTSTIRIKGVEKLHGIQNYKVIPDQIEAGTFMIATAMTGGDVYIEDVIPKHLNCIAFKLMEMGVEIEYGEDYLRVIAKNRLKPTSVITLPYPGFPTDLQPQIAVALGIADGISVVQESVFDRRFEYVDEMSRIGANMRVTSDVNIITGVNSYKGAIVKAPDLRAGAALVLAGLVSKRKTTVKNIEYIKRGYEDFDGKLRSLGADIKEIEK
jgi:UDP-N-acetylglucosamine 1-carboxyvinyltransferase